MSIAGWPPLRVAAPAQLRLWLAWLIAGPLNAVQFGWFAAFQLAGDEQTAGLAWILGACCAFGVGIAYLFAQGRAEYSAVAVIVLALKTWLWISGVLIFIACGLTASVALLTLIFGLGVAVCAGLPAAIYGAAVARLVIFRESTTQVTPPQSATP